jgi:hypothetical protein
VRSTRVEREKEKRRVRFIFVTVEGLRARLRQAAVRGRRPLAESGGE